MNPENAGRTHRDDQRVVLDQIEKRKDRSPGDLNAGLHYLLPNVQNEMMPLFTTELHTFVVGIHPTNSK